MTLRLYYRDAKLLEFAAQILERKMMQVQEAHLQERSEFLPAVRLDQTAFYPTSGGQPYDTGSLGGVPVVEVQEDDGGEIWHLLAGSLDTSDPVVGHVDWPRRFDHMQQHSGQHLLSAGLEDHLSAHTIGFHLGSEVSTIDLDIPDLTWDQAADVERVVNTVVWENRAVVIRDLDQAQVVDAANVLGLPLRKPPAVTGEIRVILVEGYDASACGGTHVQATGEIGLTKIVGIERHKGGVRVDFLCGGRALRAYQRDLQLLRTSSLGLSVGPVELPEAIDRLEEEVKEGRRELRRLRATLADYETEALWASAPVREGVRVILAHWDDRSFADARAIAGRLRERPRALILMAVTEERGVRLVVARSDDLPACDAAAILGSAMTSLGGRGGGTSSLAQGGAPPQAAVDILAALRHALEECGLALDGLG